MKRWLIIALGTLLMALGLNGFFAPHNIVTGGATGISLIVLRLFDIPMWFTNLAVNMPLFVVSYKFNGIKYTRDSLFSTILLSFFIGLTENLPYFETDTIIACVFGGILEGSGIGLIVKGNSSTGGSDLAATLIKKALPHLSIANIMLMIDVCILTLGCFVLGISSVLYAIIAVYVLSKVINTVLEGFDFAKAAFIISDKADEIGHQVTTNLKRGATLFNGTGVYTRHRRDMVIVVMSAKQIAKLKAIATEIDANSFVFVTDVREIAGDFRKADSPIFKKGF